MDLTWLALSGWLYGGAVATRDSAWTTVLAKGDSGQTISARVFLTDGSSWVGAVEGFSNDNQWADREIILLDPLLLGSDGKRGPVLPGQLVIPSAVIAGVHARPDAGANPTPTADEPPAEGA